jgi:malonyl-CoA O-methyltransferase
MMPIRSLNATYDKWSRTYDRTPNPLVPIEEIAVHSLLRMISFKNVLDAGTGTGRYAIKLAGQGKRVIAVDTNINMLNEARKKASVRKLTIKFLANDIKNLSFEDESFDLVVCALTLAHIESLDEPCHELVRVLMSNGSLLISD